MLNRIELPGYTIRSGGLGEGSWLQYDYTEKKYHSDINKVHISIQHDISTLQKAQALILPILAEHHISSFKTINPNSFSSHINVDGKEFCIYMQIDDSNSLEGNPEFWIGLLNKIETTLEINGIAKHPKGALADLLFPGSKGYVYYRNSYNISKNYVGAVVLMNSGFTRKEACEISTNDFLRGHSLSGGAINSTAHETSASLTLELTDGLSEIDNELKQSILDSLYRQLTNNDNLLKLFAGSEGEFYTHTETWCDILFGTQLSLHRRNRAFDEARSGNLDLIKPFKKYLDIAAAKIAKIATLLEKNGYHFDSEKLGSILPALYFNFYVPLCSAKTGAQIIELGDNDAEKLVNEIVRCSLRDTTKTAIDYELPQYIYDLNEKDVSILLSLVELKQKIITELPQQETISTQNSSLCPIDLGLIIDEEQINPVKFKTLEEQSSRTKNLDLQSRAIDKILDKFAADIQSIGTHYPNVKHTTEELLKNLRQYKHDAFKEPTKQSLETFAQQAKDSIKAATPELQRDLGWGDYLVNLAKKILNAITTAFAYTVTLGTSNHHGFFVLKPSQAAEKAHHLGRSLDSEFSL